MKRIFYPFVIVNKLFFIFFLASLLVSGAINAQPYSAFGAGDFPAGGAGGADANQNDPGPEAIETGVKFRVTQAGQINGVRFYKGTSNTGTHVGQLWSNTGALLATVTFAGETASGWQQMDFASPVSVTAGVIFIASVYMPTGTYASSFGFFSSQWENDGIQLIGSGESPNGVFDYTTTGPLAAPPSSSFGGSNYWIDISFTPFFPLPVSLSDFGATTNTNNVVLSWKTGSENNNRGFDVQRSNNGSDWYSIGFVNGAGESHTTKSYSYTDKSLAPGLYYYRLNQVDFDGKAKTSNVVTATVGGKGSVSLYQNFPNPFIKTTSIRFDLPVTQKVRLSVIDLAGREVKVLANKQAEAGTHLVSLDATGLSRQVYIVRLQTESGILTRRILLE